ncbi:MAG: phosphoribosylglycinamide formyltransferase [Planctomycetota bacterium]
MTVKIGVLLSGGGTTLGNLLEKIGEGDLDAEVICVLSSRPGVKGLEIARDAGIPSRVVPRKAYDAVEEFSGAITEFMDMYEVDLVVMAGFLSLWKMPERYHDRVMNIHPALIPLFCGKGFYGHRVHDAVVESGVKFSGCTVHFADDRYDTGPIILQRTVPVCYEDTADDVAARVFVEECIAYPEAIRLFGEGRLEVDGKRVRVLPGEDD